ncbi:alpha-protein kinase vwkA [Ditylenchus destructor]|uniref:Alpha-protein kinase vwkA n=1 Tax=Ditylenchus destructor TaxID=166010 RepID=A0AAD4MRL6_9BILA|nr:alpha-protein kinase vwkA [Ditylenchus destructor]
MSSNDQASFNLPFDFSDFSLSDRNKSLRQIYEDEGLNYGKDVSAAELKSRMSNAVKLRKASVANVLKLINSSRKVQLCFLVDVTGSMTSYIDGVRDSILRIVEKLTAAGSGAIAKEVSLAFVGYRDFGYENPFELLPFTENAENFRQFCSKIQTTRGPKYMIENDMPEDVFGGLEKAISNLSWSDQMCTKIIFHIADHPCHGKKYHTSNYPYSDRSNDNHHSDRYPDGDPNGRTEEMLFNALREKGIQYHFGKITSHTDKMIELFSEAMGSEIEVFDIKNVDKLVDCIVSSVSIGTSVLPSMKAKKLDIKTEKAMPDWSKLPIFKGAYLSYEMPETVIEVISDVPMTPKRATKAKIQIAEHPFAHGSERKVFYGNDMSSNSPTDIVLKEYIRQNTDAASRSAAIPYEIATQMQTIAEYLASVFNVCLKEKAGIIPENHLELYIKFLKVQVKIIFEGDENYPVPLS